MHAAIDSRAGKPIVYLAFVVWLEGQGTVFFE